MPKVSVIVAAYNASSFLAQTIDGILNQTFKDFELIVVDDCSTDDTPLIVQGYRDPRIRLIRNPRNLGVAATRNVGVDAASGEYVAANDHDDVSLPLRLERQVAFLDRNPDVLMVGTASYSLSEAGRKPDPIPSPAHHVLRWMLMTHSPLCHSTICSRLDAIHRHGLYYDPECDFGDDFDLYHRMAEVGRISSIPERLLLYRWHPGNASRRYREDMNARGRAMLSRVHERVLGGPLAAHELEALWKVVTSFYPAASGEELLLVGRALERLLEAYLRLADPVPLEREEVRRAASRQWWEAVDRTAVRLGSSVRGHYLQIPGLTTHAPTLLDSLRRHAARTIRRVVRAGH